jgi:hypothetical protein
VMMSYSVWEALKSASFLEEDETEFNPGLDGVGFEQRGSSLIPMAQC